MLFWIFISLVIIQRLAELVISKRNQKLMLSKGAVEFDKHGYRYIVMMHTAFFVCLVSEWVFLKRDLNFYWVYLLIIFILAQVLRYWSIASLGYLWNTKIIVLKGSRLVSAGPYKYLKHPNYIAVITEILVIPLIFSCYITCIVFSILNIIVLTRRIKIEQTALQELIS